METAAITRKAMPVSSLSPPVINHTTKATIAAGKKKNTTFAMNTIIKTPIIKRINKTANSRSHGRKANTTPPTAA
ncbi:MAG: hypothetical protein PVF15_08665 [Candidatus Bathyarchaeota archaeon]|jgi:hypothetical protein